MVDQAEIRLFINDPPPPKNLQLWFWVVLGSVYKYVSWWEAGCVCVVCGCFHLCVEARGWFWGVFLCCSSPCLFEIVSHTELALAVIRLAARVPSGVSLSVPCPSSAEGTAVGHLRPGCLGHESGLHYAESTSLTGWPLQSHPEQQLLQQHCRSFCWCYAVTEVLKPKCLSNVLFPVL